MGIGIGIIIVTDGADGADTPPIVTTVIGAAAPADASPAVPAATPGALRVTAGALYVGDGLPVPMTFLLDAMT